MRRIVQKMLPDGTIAYVQPFHVSLEGMETAVLCRDDGDYDATVKIICVAARRKNVIVIIYAVVSNHCHIGVLAESQEVADAYANEVKRMISMWIQKKYGDNKIMKNTDAVAIGLDNDWYLRNALAYIPRNALDNGCNVGEYRWSGYRAMFSSFIPPGCRKVCMLTKRDRERILHTGDDLRRVTWLIDANDELVPSSFCDSAYLEQAFDNDPAFFLKTIGTLNVADMKNRLVDAPRTMQTDTDFYKTVNEICVRWFKKGIGELSLEGKTRLIPYIYRTNRTTESQLARVFGLEKQRIHALLHPGIR